MTCGLNYTLLDILGYSDDVFLGFSNLILDFFQNIDHYVVYLLRGLLFLGVFSIFWTFFQKFNHELKTSVFISRLFANFLIFYAAWILSRILNVPLIEV